ncbi:MAG: hypothetical protein HKN03_01230 [Acidimicrobiales bacterium]|nr:hypothetical protein [Acidimicrobiia bacterium]NNF53041.1 hypothetical protein [Acidimicrobiales bacterium]
MTLTGCGSSPTIDSSVEELVASVVENPGPEVFSIDFVPVNPSPYVACLQGIDEVRAVIDRPGGIIRLQPRRSAPPILVAPDRVLVESQEAGDWFELPLPTASDRPALEQVFGTSLAGFIMNGVAEPNLNETAAALLSVADEVGTAPTPVGLPGSSFEVIVDSDKYLAESGGGSDVPIPTATVTATASGEVTGIAIARSATGSAEDEGGPYALVGRPFEELLVQLPDENMVREQTLSEVLYPRPQQSCRFS